MNLYSSRSHTIFRMVYFYILTIVDCHLDYTSYVAHGYYYYALNR